MKYVDIQFHLTSKDFFSFYIWDDEDINHQLISRHNSLEIENLQQIKIPSSITSFDEHDPSLQLLIETMEQIEEFTLSINAAFCEEYGLDEDIVYSDTYQAYCESFYSQFIIKYANKMTNLIDYLCEEAPLRSFIFITNHLQYLVNLQHITLKSDEFGTEFYMEDIDFTPKLVSFLQKVPSPHLLKTLVLDTNIINFEASDMLSTCLQRFQNLESFFILSNFSDSAIQDVFCSTLKVMPSIKRIHLDFSNSGGESLLYISSVLENENLREFNFIISGSPNISRFDFRNEEPYSTDLEFMHFAGLVANHPALRTLKFHIDLSEYDYYIVSDDDHNHAENPDFYILDNSSHEDVSLIQQRALHNLQAITTNLSITRLASNIIPSRQTHEITFRNRNILEGKQLSQHMTNFIQYFQNNSPLTHAQSLMMTAPIQADKALLFYYKYLNIQNIHALNQVINESHAAISLLLNDLKFIEKEHFKKTITPADYQEQTAALFKQKTSLEQILASQRLEKINLNTTYTVFSQQLLRNIIPWFLPEHINQLVLDYLDIKSLGKLQIATGGFFRTETKEKQKHEENVNSIRLK